MLEKGHGSGSPAILIQTSVGPPQPKRKEGKCQTRSEMITATPSLAHFFRLRCFWNDGNWRAQKKSFYFTFWPVSAWIFSLERVKMTAQSIWTESLSTQAGPVSAKRSTHRWQQNVDKVKQKQWKEYFLEPRASQDTTIEFILSFALRSIWWIT